MKAKKWEGSKADRKADSKGAKKLGEPLKAYERSPQDKKADAKAQAELDRKAKAKR